MVTTWPQVQTTRYLGDGVLNIGGLTGEERAFYDVKRLGQFRVEFSRNSRMGDGRGYEREEEKGGKADTKGRSGRSLQDRESAAVSDWWRGGASGSQSPAEKRSFPRVPRLSPSLPLSSSQLPFLFIHYNSGSIYPHLIPLN